MEPTTPVFENSRLFRYSIGVFTEKRLNGLAQLSYGRALLALLVCVDLYFWLWVGKDVPATLGTLTLAIAGYVIGSKTVEAGKSIAGTIAGALTKRKAEP